MTINQAIRKALLITPQSVTLLHFRVNQLRGTQTTLETFGPQFRKWRRLYPYDFDESEAKTKKGHTFKRFARNENTLKRKV